MKPLVTLYYNMLIKRYNIHAYMYIRHPARVYTRIYIMYTCDVVHYNILLL